MKLNLELYGFTVIGVVWSETESGKKMRALNFDSVVFDWIFELCQANCNYTKFKSSSSQFVFIIIANVFAWIC